MSSGPQMSGPKYGKYLGNGSATEQLFECGFRPKKVKVMSVEGLVILHHILMPGAWHAVNGAAAAFLGAIELKMTDTGFSIESADNVLNKSAVEYFFEAY